MPNQQMKVAPLARELPSFRVPHCPRPQLDNAARKLSLGRGWQQDQGPQPVRYFSRL